MNQLLKDRTALVTGSSRGIGAAIARKLAQAGARVVVHANRTAREAEQIAQEISNKGGKARAIRGDLSSANAAGEVVRSAFSQFGGLDILVNNAAILGGGAIEKLTEQEIDKLLAINVRSVLLATREFVLASKTTCGRIINISSIAGRLPSPGASLYSASKAAVESLTRSHAMELGHRKITVNAVAPGTTETEMSVHGFPSELLQLMATVTPLGRLGQPDDIADAVVFLCCDAASWITGQVIGADGGQLTTLTMLGRVRDSIRAQLQGKAA
jgi:3-oxoacyl-[acyl-carrier protein] reductase